MATNSAEQVREFYRKQGEQREQERIIKLLEENAEHFEIGGGYEASYDMALGLIKNEEWAIALIKGGNK